MLSKREDVHPLVMASVLHVPQPSANGRFLKKLIWEKESVWERFVMPLINAFIGWFLYEPGSKAEPATLAYQDHILTHCATQPELTDTSSFSFFVLLYCSSCPNFSLFALLPPAHPQLPHSNKLTLAVMKNYRLRWVGTSCIWSLCGKRGGLGHQSYFMFELRSPFLVWR